MFKTTFNNISVISWWSVLLVEEATDLLQVTDKLKHIYVVASTPCLSGIRTHNLSGDRHWLQQPYDHDHDRPSSKFKIIDWLVGV